MEPFYYKTKKKFKKQHIYLPLMYQMGYREATKWIARWFFVKESKINSWKISLSLKALPTIDFEAEAKCTNDAIARAFGFKGYEDILIHKGNAESEDGNVEYQEIKQIP